MDRVQGFNQHVVKDALRNVNQDTKRRRRGLRRFKFRSAPIDPDAFDKDRSKYDEHVIALVNDKPGPTFGKTVRYKFKKYIKKSPTPPKPEKSTKKPASRTQPSSSSSSESSESEKERVTPPPVPADAYTQTDPKSSPPKPTLKRTTPDIVTYIPSPPGSPILRVTTPQLLSFIHTHKRLLTTTPVEITTYFPSANNFRWTSLDIVEIKPREVKHVGVGMKIEVKDVGQDPPSVLEDPDSTIMSSASTGTEADTTVGGQQQTPAEPPVDQNSDVSIILVKIEKLMELCMTVHSKCPTDNRDILAFISEVHQDLIARLDALRKEKEEEEEAEKACLCTWLRIHISTSEYDSYMYTVNPKCPRCTLCQQGRQLLKAAGINPNGYRDLWLALGTLVSCLETDDEDLFGQVLDNEIPEELIAKVSVEIQPPYQSSGVDSLPGVVTPNSSVAAAGTSSSPVKPTKSVTFSASTLARNESGNHSMSTVATMSPDNSTLITVPHNTPTSSLTAVFRLLVCMGEMWGAKRCVIRLLQWLNVPSKMLDDLRNHSQEQLNRERYQKENGKPHDKIGDKISNINIINNNVFQGNPADKAQQEIKCIFEAIRRKNVLAFKVLLDGQYNDLLPTGAKNVYLKTDKEPDSDIDGDDRCTVFELLIVLSYSSHQVNGKEDDCYLEMIDYIYQPNAIRKWARLGDASKAEKDVGKHDRWTYDAIQDLIYGGDKDEDHTNTKMLDYAAKHGTSGVMNKILNNPPYRRKDKETPSSRKKCYMTNGLDDTIEILNDRASQEVIGPILHVEPLQTMINDKWLSYRPWYCISLIWYLCFMVIFTICASFRPIGAASVYNMYVTPGDYARLFGEFLIIIGMWYLFYTIIQELRVSSLPPRPWRRYGLYIYLNILLFIFVFVTIICRLSLNENEDIVLAMALLCGWSGVVHRVAAFKKTGMFAIIMHHCIWKDFLPGFIWVFLIMLVALSTATFTVYQTAPENQLPDFPNSTYWVTPFSLFKLTFGLLETEYATETRWSGIGVVLFLLYLYLMNVVLFNLLISMLGTTYQNIHDVVNKYWIQIRLSYVLLVEKWWPNLKLKYNTTDGSQPSCGKVCCVLCCCPELRGEYTADGNNCFVAVPLDHALPNKKEIYIM